MRGIFHYLPFLTLVVKTRDSVSCSWLRFFPVVPSCHFPSVSDGNKYNVQIIMSGQSLLCHWILPDKTSQARSSFHIADEGR